MPLCRGCSFVGRTALRAPHSRRTPPVIFCQTCQKDGFAGIFGCGGDMNVVMRRNIAYAVKRLFLKKIGKGFSKI